MGFLKPLQGRVRVALRGRSLRVAAGALILVLACSVVAWAAGESEPSAAEYRVKAAFLYKFGDYIEWPDDAFASADSPLVIGVVGADIVADELAKIVGGRTVGGRKVVVQKLRHGDPAVGVHLLFVGRSEAAQLPALLASAKGKAIATVTEADAAPSPHGVINFVVVDDKVRFDIDLQPAERGNLKISSRLLAVARKVLSGPS
jgi:hypothetical protein